MRMTTAIAAIALGLAACGGQAETEPEPPAPAVQTDPYEAYLELAPHDAPELSREDAQARAYLGCGQSFAPGTVDAALAEAYVGICD